MRLQLVAGTLWLLSNVWLGEAIFFKPGWRLHGSTDAMSLMTANQAVDPRYGPFHFDQRINHSDPNTRTFRQRYWANSDWYEEGGPVILYNAGELAADWRSKYVTNSSMALLARELKGAVVVVEHRCYGESQPGSDWSVRYLRTLNTEQALADMAYFIQNAKLPNLAHIPPAPETKWIVYGGSYSGNLAAWMRYKYPDLVFAAVPSSAPVEMKYNFYEYFNAIKRYAPTHCVGAIERVVAYVDHILFSFFTEPKQKLKEKFGVRELAHDDDFAELLTYPLGLWQDMQPDKNPFGTEFCSIFDGKVTLHEQVDAYADYIAKRVQEACKDSPSITACLDTHDPKSPMYTDLKVEIRPWLWQVCTEYAYWQTASPIWQTSLVSRKLTTHWYQHMCPLMFGEHEVPPVPAWRKINEEYKGWYLRLTRTFWIDGEWDPWRTLSVQSDNAPDRCGWNDDAEFVVLPESVHHWDFFDSEFVSQDIKATQHRMLETLRRWLNEDAERLPYVRYKNP